MSNISKYFYYNKGSSRHSPTLDRFSAVDLGELILNKLVSLLADGDDLLARDTELGYGGKDLLGNTRSHSVLGESVWVRQRVV